MSRVLVCALLVAAVAQVECQLGPGRPRIRVNYPSTVLSVVKFKCPFLPEEVFNARCPNGRRPTVHIVREGNKCPASHPVVGTLPRTCCEESPNKYCMQYDVFRPHGGSVPDRMVCRDPNFQVDDGKLCCMDMMRDLCIAKQPAPPGIAPHVAPPAIAPHAPAAPSISITHDENHSEEPVSYVGDGFGMWR